MLTILAFFGVLIVLIITHEVGHFVAAKKFGVKVFEFGLGYPPRVFGFKRGGTTYSFNLLPFGGFVKLEGEEDPSKPGSLAGKSIPVRLLVLSAGSIMNLLLPVLLLSASLALPHDTLIENVIVKEVALDSPSMAAGIEAGDRIIAVNGRTVDNRAKLTFLVRTYLGQEIVLKLEKADKSEREVRLRPRWTPPPGQGAIGVTLQGSEGTAVNQSEPFWQALPDAVWQAWSILVLFRNEVIGWFTRGTTPQLAGPVGIAQMTGEVARAGVSPLLEFTALISLNLGILNLFPFPGLDGGRLVFVLLEWVRRGKRISPKKEGLVHIIGFAILILAILAVTYNDIMRIVSGDSLLP